MTLSMVERDGGVTSADDAAVAAVRARIAAGPRLPLAEPVLDEAAARDAARRAVADLVDAEAMDEVLAQIKGDGLRLTGPGGVPVRAGEGGPGARVGGGADRSSGLRQAQRGRQG
jgi:putative transposase